MIYQQDWLMRQIEAIAAIIAYLLTGKKAKHAAWEEAIEEAERSDGFYRHLSDMVKQGRICEAENELFAAAQGENEEILKTAMMFYASVNKLSDKELEERDFSRAEILDGMRDICAAYDVPCDLFL